jgi:hypothetical protein
VNTKAYTNVIKKPISLTDILNKATNYAYCSRQALQPTIPTIYYGTGTDFPAQYFSMIWHGLLCSHRLRLLLAPGLPEDPRLIRDYCHTYYILYH